MKRKCEDSVNPLVEEALSTVEKVTREVFGITKMIYRKKTKNPVRLVNPVKDLRIC